MQFFILTPILTTIGCRDTTPSDSPNKMTADVPSARAKTAQQKSTTQEEVDASKAETESQKETQKDAGKTIKSKFVDETGKRLDFSGQTEEAQQHPQQAIHVLQHSSMGEGSLLDEYITETNILLQAARNQG